MSIDYQQDMKAIFIGTILRGPETGRRVDRCYDTFFRVVINTARAQKHDPQNFQINIVFCFPGSLGDFDFRGIEVGRLSRKQRSLRVDVYVPEAMYNSEQLMDFFIESSRQAVELAAAKLHKKKCPFDKEQCIQLIDQSARMLRSTTHN